MLRHEKAPHVAQHHQDVLVNGVNMKQVMLHLTDDFAEYPQIPAQHRCLVHHPQRMRDAFWLLKNAFEGVAINRITAKAGCHDATGVVQRTQRSG